MSKFHRKPAGKKKAKSNGPLPPCPKSQFIRVVQFQYFDNGPNCGKGKSRYTMTIEAYCEDKFNIYKPYWKRTASLLDPEQVKKWADDQMSEGKMAAADHYFYVTLHGAAEALMENATSEFVKIGYIEDRRSKIRYPGQVILVTKELDGPMKASLFTDGMNEDPACSDPFVFDKFSKPGSGRRLFFGFYDPQGLYARTKAIAEKERAYLAGHPPVRAAEPDPFRDFMRTSPF
jgi:hypothetical protein